MRNMTARHRRLSRSIYFPLGSLLGLCGVACGGGGEGQLNPGIGSTGGDRVTLPGANPELEHEAELVLVGEVVDTTAYRSNAHDFINTLTRVRVAEIEKGDVPEEIVVRSRGGRLPNDDFVFVSHEPVFEVGEASRLYLRPVSADELAAIHAESDLESEHSTVYEVVGGDRGKQDALDPDLALSTGCGPSDGYCVSKWSSGAWITPLSYSTFPVSVTYDRRNSQVPIGDIGAVRMAMDAWEDEPSSRMDYHFAGTANSSGWNDDGKNTVFWTSVFFGTDLAQTVLRGSGTRIREFDVGLNTNQPFATTVTSGKYLLQDTLLHELGHALNLGHVEDQNQIMYHTGKRGGGRTRLQWGDRAGVRALYEQGEIPAVGDVNGDGRDDIITFTNNVWGDVWVATSHGTGFNATTIWNDWAAPAGEDVGVGDFNGDGYDDVAVFTQGESADVWVCLSNGVNRFNPCTLWHSSFAGVGWLPRVGDVNGDGAADIVAFPRYSTTSSGSVRVALSTRFGFGSVSTWRTGFPTGGGKSVAVADVNADYLDDIISMDNGVEHSGDLWVSISNGTGFNTPSKWTNNFCANQRAKGIVGYVDGDHRADFVCVYTDAGGQQPYVYRSTGSGLQELGWIPFGTGNSYLHSFFIAKMGTRNGSLVDFQHCSLADVRVALKTASSWNLPAKWHEFFSPRPDPC